MKRTILVCGLVCLLLAFACGRGSEVVEIAPTVTPRLDVDLLPEIVLVALDRPQEGEPPVVNTDTRTPPVIQLSLFEAPYRWLYVVDGNVLTQCLIGTDAFNFVMGNSTYNTYRTQTIKITDKQLAELTALADEVEANVGDFVIGSIHSTGIPKYAGLLYKGITYFVSHTSIENRSVGALVDRLTELSPRMDGYRLSTDTLTPPPELNTNKVLPADGTLKFAFAIDTTVDYQNQYLVEIKNGNMSVSLIDVVGMLAASNNAMIANVIYDVKWTCNIELTADEEDALFKAAEYAIANAAPQPAFAVRTTMLYCGATYAFRDEPKINELIKTFSNIVQIPYTVIPFEEAMKLFEERYGMLPEYFRT